MLIDMGKALVLILLAGIGKLCLKWKTITNKYAFFRITVKTLLKTILMSTSDMHKSLWREMRSSPKTAWNLVCWLFSVLRFVF